MFVSDRVTSPPRHSKKLEFRSATTRHPLYNFVAASHRALNFMGLARNLAIGRCISLVYQVHAAYFGIRRFVPPQPCAFSSHTLNITEFDDILLRSPPVTTNWSRHGNFEVQGLDPITSSALSPNSIFRSVLVEMEPFPRSKLSPDTSTFLNSASPNSINYYLLEIVPSTTLCSPL